MHELFCKVAEALPLRYPLGIWVKNCWWQILVDFFRVNLEDRAPGRRWIRGFHNHGDRKFPKDRVIPLPNGLDGLYIEVTNYLLTGMILQEPPPQKKIHGI